MLGGSVRLRGCGPLVGRNFLFDRPEYSGAHQAGQWRAIGCKAGGRCGDQVTGTLLQVQEIIRMRGCIDAACV